MRKILIVVDMQNDFVTGSLGTPEAQAIVPRVVDKIDEYGNNGYLIVFTKDTHYKDYFQSLEGKYLPVKHCILGTEGHKLIPEITRFYNYDIIEKESFGFNNWRNYLAESFSLIGSIPDIPWYDDVQFELIGLCTDICVISNALILRAQFPDSEIIVHADCCAGTTPEKHAAALEVMKSCQILVEGE